jgi:hypothetical protein
MSTSLKDLAEAIRKAKHLTVFTGAGVSTLSGLRDFRGENGLYREFDADNIFDSLYFSYDPSFYYRHTKDFIYSSTQKDASIVHVVLARLERLGYVKAKLYQLSEEVRFRFVKNAGGSTSRTLHSLERPFLLQPYRKRFRKVEPVILCWCSVRLFLSSRQPRFQDMCFRGAAG